MHLHSLEHELHTELERPGSVRVNWMQERIARQTRSISRRVRSAPITIDNVVAGVPWVHGVVHAELRVVERIE